jgi:hypothetical protein
MVGRTKPTVFPRRYFVKCIDLFDIDMYLSSENKLTASERKVNVRCVCLNLCQCDEDVSAIRIIDDSDTVGQHVSGL